MMRVLAYMLLFFMHVIKVKSVTRHHKIVSLNCLRWLQCSKNHHRVSASRGWDWKVAMIDSQKGAFRSQCLSKPACYSELQRKSTNLLLMDMLRHSLRGVKVHRWANTNWTSPVGSMELEVTPERGSFSLSLSLSFPLKLETKVTNLFKNSFQFLVMLMQKL